MNPALASGSAASKSSALNPSEKNGSCLTAVNLLLQLDGASGRVALAPAGRPQISRRRLRAERRKTCSSLQPSQSTQKTKPLRLTPTHATSRSNEMQSKTEWLKAPQDRKRTARKRGTNECCYPLCSCATAERVIMQIWITTHFGMESGRPPSTDESLLFIKVIFTPLTCRRKAAF